MGARHQRACTFQVVLYVSRWEMPGRITYLQTKRPSLIITYSTHILITHTGRENRSKTDTGTRHAFSRSDDRWGRESPSVINLSAPSHNIRQRSVECGSPAHMSDGHEHGSALPTRRRVAGRGARRGAAGRGGVGSTGGVRFELFRVEPSRVGRRQRQRRWWRWRCPVGRLGLFGVLLAGGGLSETVHLLSGPADGVTGRLLQLLETRRLAVVLRRKHSGIRLTSWSPEPERNLSCLLGVNSNNNTDVRRLIIGNAMNDPQTRDMDRIFQ